MIYPFTKSKSFLLSYTNDGDRHHIFYNATVVRVSADSRSASISFMESSESSGGLTVIGLSCLMQFMKAIISFAYALKVESQETVSGTPSSG